MNVQWMVGVVIGVGTTAACADSDNAPLTVTRAQLADQIGSGPLRIEVELRADGSVREVQIEDELGHEEQLEGRVTAIDAAAQRLDIEHLGSVTYGDARRFRDDDDVSADTWVASVQAALSAGRAVWIDARGDFGPDAFNANELRFDDGDIKVEADVTAEDYNPASGVLRIGALTFAIGDARIGDDRGNGADDDAFDDNGGDDSTDDSDDDDSFDDSDGDDNESDDSDDDDAFDDNGDDSTDDNGGDDSTDDNGGDDSTDDNGSDDSTDDNGSDDSTDDNGSDDSTDDNGSDDSTDDNGDDSTDDNGGDDSTDDSDDDDSADDLDDDHGRDRDD